MGDGDSLHRRNWLFQIMSINFKNISYNQINFIGEFI
jgi:hypothetical protein